MYKINHSDFNAGFRKSESRLRLSNSKHRHFRNHEKRIPLSGILEMASKILRADGEDYYSVKGDKKFQKIERVNVAR